MRDREILYLNRADIQRIRSAQLDVFVRAVEEALRLHAQRMFVQPLKPYLRWRGEDSHIADRIIAMPAYVGGARPAAGLKWIGSKHDNPTSHGLERASAVIILNDVDTHYPIAILEGGLISNCRTAAVTAVAAKHLARRAFTRVCCIGSGPIGRMQLDTLIEHFPGIREIYLFDLDAGAARRHAASLEQNEAVSVTVTSSAETAVRAAEVIITATVTARPYLPFEWLARGAFVSNVSIMDVEPDVFLKVDKLVVDDWDQCNREKKVIHQLVESGKFSRDRLHSELGQVVTGMRPGREDADEIIMLNPMGMAVEDIACAQAVFRAALDRGVGTWLPR